MSYSDDDQVIGIQRNDLTAIIAVHISTKLAEEYQNLRLLKRQQGASVRNPTRHRVAGSAGLYSRCFNKGSIRDVTVVNELVTAYKQDPEEVQKLLEENEGEDITRSAVKVFRSSWTKKNPVSVIQTPLTPSMAVPVGSCRR